MRMISLEKFARWAVCEELPKSRVPERVEGRPAPGAMVTAWGAVELGTRIDKSLSRDVMINEFGLAAMDMPDPPHVDAILLHQALCEIDADRSMLIDVPNEVLDGISLRVARDIEDWQAAAGNCLKDALVMAMGQVTRADADGRTWPHRGAWGIVAYVAIMGGLDVKVDPMRLAYQTLRGKPLWFRRVPVLIDGVMMVREIDGYNERRQRPYPDAYRRPCLTPHPADAIGRRIEWVMWQAVLQEAMRRLEDKLLAHRLVMPAAGALPWIGGGGERLWVVEDAVRALPSKEKRKRRIA